MPEGREDEYKQDVSGATYYEKIVDGQTRRIYPEGYKNLSKAEVEAISDENPGTTGDTLRKAMDEASRVKATSPGWQPQEKEIGSDVFTIPKGGNVWTATKVMNERFGTNVPVQDVLRDHGITDETTVQPGTQIDWTDYIRSKQGMELLDEPER